MRIYFKKVHLNTHQMGCVLSTYAQVFSFLSACWTYPQSCHWFDLQREPALQQNEECKQWEVLSTSQHAKSCLIHLSASTLVITKTQDERGWTNTKSYVPPPTCNNITQKKSYTIKLWANRTINNIRPKSLTFRSSKRLPLTWGFRSRPREQQGP